MNVPVEAELLIPPPRKRAVVTGGTGYIGRHLVDHLTETGTHVTVLTRQTLESTSSVTYVRIDGSLQSMTDALAVARPHSVVHLAASYVRIHTLSDLPRLLEANVGLGMMLIEAMKQAEVANLVLAGSYFQRTGRTPGVPRSLYAATKNAFEDILEFYESDGAIIATRLTICDVYGEDDTRGRLMNVLAEATRSGNPVRVPKSDVYVAPVHISDVARAFELAIRLKSSQVARYWVGPSSSILVSEVVRIFERLSGTAVRLEQTDIQTLPGDDTPLVPGEPLPGWQLEVGLEAGVARLLDAL